MRTSLFAPKVCHLAAVVLGLSLLIPGVMASDDHRPDGRFDHLVRGRDGGALAVAPRTLGELEPTDALRLGWEKFAAENGGNWSVYIDERSGLPTMLSGRGIEWVAGDALSSASLEDLQALAEEFLSNHRGLLGHWSEILVFDQEASHLGRNGHWQIVFRQVVDGVRVEEARLDFHLKRGRMVMMGASHWGRPMISGVPTLDPESARQTLDAYIGQSTLEFEPAGEPELTIVPLDAELTVGEPQIWTGARGQGVAHALVWRLKFHQPGEPAQWVGEVDAHDGTLVSFYDGAQYSSVRGGVFPNTSDGECAGGGCEVAGFPMPFADYTEEGQIEEHADAFGNLACSVSEASFETNLSGPYVNISDNCGTPSAFGSCSDGLDLGLKEGDNCEVEPGGAGESTSAARTTFYHINRAMELARFYDPGNTWLESPLTVNVNVSSSCNANWTGTLINMYGAGSNCRNTGEIASILVHEWGHGYDYNDGGGTDSPGEAYADIVAVLATRDSCMSHGIYNDGSTCEGWGNPCLTCTGFRDFDWTAREWNTPATPTGWAQNSCPPDFSSFAGPCRRQPHCESYLSTEAIYDLVTRDLPAAGMDLDSAWQLVERLWYETRPGSGGNAYLCLLPIANSCSATSWFQRMRVADDDDGDLSNGTPHGAALFAAFDRHDISCGDASDPENQSTSSCPTLAAPVVSAIELPGGTELSWSAVTDAAEYRIYRGDLGCHAQQIPIAVVAAGETTYLDSAIDPDFPRTYRVEVFGANPACTSPVSNCVATPLGARLQEYSHRVIDDAHDNDAIPEPGETVQIPVTLLNSGVEASVGAVGNLRLVSPAQVRVLGPDASWSSIAPSGLLESQTPHFEVVVLEEALCGDLLTFEFDSSAANAGARRSRLSISMGERDRDFAETEDVTIPPETTGPVTSTIVIGQDQTLADMDVSVNVRHDQADQLIIELTSPEGTTVRLHDRSPDIGSGVQTRYDLETLPDGPGTMDDFIGESTQGTWSLTIEDLDNTGPTGDGFLRDWTLHASVSGGFDCEVKTCPEPPPAQAPELAVAIASGGIDLDLSWTAVGGATAYHVLESTSPAYDSNVQLIERTQGTTHTLSDGAQPTPGLSYFQVRGTNSCHQEGP